MDKASHAELAFLEETNKWLCDIGIKNMSDLNHRIDSSEERRWNLLDKIIDAPIELLDLAEHTIAKNPTLINLPGHLGMTPLMMASYHNNVSLLYIFAKQGGADVSLTDDHRRNALQYYNEGLGPEELDSISRDFDKFRESINPDRTSEEKVKNFLNGTSPKLILSPFARGVGKARVASLVEMFDKGHG